VKINKTSAYVLFFIAGFIFLCNGCDKSEKTYELRFAQPFSPKHTMQVELFEVWANKIHEMTDGRVKVTMYPGGALGKTTDHYDLVEKGIADFLIKRNECLEDNNGILTKVEVGK